MSELGVFAVDRAVFEHPLFSRGEPYTRREAWLWLISEAAWKPRRVDRGGQIIELRRGQLAHSVRFMADVWGWSKSSVDRFLTRLKTETMIGTEAGTGFLIVTICKYDEFQRVSLPDRDASRDADRDSSGTAAGQTKDIQNIQYNPLPSKGRRGRDAGYGDKTDPLFADFHANVWSKRWKRKGHEPLPAFRFYAKMTPADREAVKASIEHFAKVIEATASEEVFRPLLASWLNKRGWEADTGGKGTGDGPDWAKWVAAYRANGVWSLVALGPEPGQPNCRVPRKFLVGEAAA